LFNNRDFRASGSTFAFEVGALGEGLDPMRAESYSLLTAGERVRVMNGALAEEIVVRKKSGYRVVLTLDLLIQSTAIEVEGDGVRPVDTSFPLSLQVTDKEIEKRAPLYQFHCLGSDFESTQVTFTTAIGHSDA
jgi:hypothetical protein